MKALVVIALVCVAGYLFLGAGFTSASKYKLNQLEAIDNAY